MAVLLFLSLLHPSWAKENPPVMVYAIGPSGSPYYDKNPGGKYEWKGLFIDIFRGSDGQRTWHETGCPAISLETCPKKTSRTVLLIS